MTIIPFPRDRARPALSFTLGVRMDLRLGAPAAWVVRASDAEEQTYTGLSRLIRSARMARMTQRGAGQLSLALGVCDYPDPALLDEAAIEAGCTKRSLTFEFDETELAVFGVEIAETLRAKGWSVAMRGRPECAMPFSARLRTLFHELVIDAPDGQDQFFAVEAEEPLSRRIAAARAAGMVLTAEHVDTIAQAKLLTLAGFDRAAGAVVMAAASRSWSVPLG